MTETQKEQRRQALTRSAGKCAICFQTLGSQRQFAHKIANTKSNREKYGAFFIDHFLNGGYVCSLKCNDKMNIGNNPEKCLQLIKLICNYELNRYL